MSAESHPNGDLKMSVVTVSEQSLTLEVEHCLGGSRHLVSIPFSEFSETLTCLDDLVGFVSGRPDWPPV